MQSLLKSTIAILASSTLLHSCVNCQEVADQVFAAIDSRNDGLRTLNTEVKQLLSIDSNFNYTAVAYVY